METGYKENVYIFRPPITYSSTKLCARKSFSSEIFLLSSNYFICTLSSLSPILYFYHGKSYFSSTLFSLQNHYSNSPFYFLDELSLPIFNCSKKFWERWIHGYNLILVWYAFCFPLIVHPNETIVFIDNFQALKKGRLPRNALGLERAENWGKSHVIFKSAIFSTLQAIIGWMDAIFGTIIQWETIKLW